MTLKLDQISHIVGGQVHLHALDMVLVPNAITVLLGATQAGKTSLMRLMAGLDQPTTGRVWVDAQDVTGVPVRERNVAMVYQQFINYPSMTVFDNIASPLRLRGERNIDAQVQALAKRLRIDPFLKRLPAELSGGQQQRVALARALAKRAPFMFLDEPLVNLDYKLREELREDLTQLFAAGEGTVVYATTEPSEALLLGGHTAVLKEGQVLQYGPTLEVFRLPQSLDVARAFSDPPINVLNAQKQASDWMLDNVRPILLPQVDAHHGRVQLGVRASALRTEQREGDVGLFGRVQLAEISGTDTFVHLDCAGLELVMQKTGVHVFDIGSTLAVYVHPQDAYVFDVDGALLCAPAHLRQGDTEMVARIDLDLAHAYGPKPQQDSDYALLPMKMSFQAGGAYALLGPSGCGKTTMLNIISGLVKPSQGQVLFNGENVNEKTPQQRNIAQVFQFPVIYDTMTVADNLAFPLRNRRMAEAQIRERVGQIAEMLELSGQLNQRAAGLSADAKQKISLGRGLVRPDVAAILFDEPLTVIDPHLKWQLRRKLKQVHQELKHTLIYVTHDQVEALTFAQEVVVMTRGRAVQVGSAEALFERPAHTFVGHFIGSPGMNFLPATTHDTTLTIGGHALTLSASQAHSLVKHPTLKLGIRPEYIQVHAQAHAGCLPAQVLRWQDLGNSGLLTTQCAGETVRVRMAGDGAAPAQNGQTVYLQVMGEHSCFYANEELIA